MTTLNSVDDGRKALRPWLIGAAAAFGLTVVSLVIALYPTKGTAPGPRLRGSQPPATEAAPSVKTPVMAPPQFGPHASLEGQAGDLMELTGTGFQPNAVLSVGYKFVSDITVDSAEKLHFVLPELPQGDYDLVLINPDGQRAVLKRAVHYTGESTIQIDSVGSQVVGGEAYLDVKNVSDRVQHLALVGAPSAYVASFPEGYTVAPGESVPVLLRVKGDAPMPDAITLQAGGVRETVKLSPQPQAAEPKEPKGAI